MNNYRSSQFRANSVVIDQHGEIIRNNVLRNTYWLLAVSLIPTVLGAILGMVSGINYGMLSNPGVSTIVFFIGAFALMSCIEKNKNNIFGVFFLLAFTFFMGIMLSRLLGIIIGMHNGAKIIAMSFGGTATIFSVMNFLANTTKRDLSNFTKWVSIGTVVILVAAIANMFMHISALTLTISMVSIIIFSSFILIDIQRVVNNGETNYISATLAIYLDIYNVFSNLLIIIGFMNNNNRE